MDKMVEKEAFGQTNQELAEISRQVDAVYEQPKPPRRKILQRVGLGIVAAGTVGLSGCRPEQIQPTKTPEKETIEISPTIVERLATEQPTEVFTPTPELTEQSVPTPEYFAAGGGEIGENLSESFKGMINVEAGFLKLVGESQDLFNPQSVQPKIFVKQPENPESSYALALESTTSYGDYEPGTIFVKSKLNPPSVDSQGVSEGRLIPIKPKQDLVLDYSFDDYGTWVLKDNENKAQWLFADNDFLVPNPEHLGRFKEVEQGKMDKLVDLAQEGINWDDEQVKPLEVNLSDKQAIVMAVDPRAESAVGRGIWFIQENEDEEKELEQFASLPQDFDAEENEIQAEFIDDTLQLSVLNSEGEKVKLYDNEERVWQDYIVPTAMSEPTETPQSTDTLEPTEESTETVVPTEEGEETKEPQTEYPSREEYIDPYFNLNPVWVPGKKEGQVNGVPGTLYYGGFWKEGVLYAVDNSWEFSPPSGRYRVALHRGFLFREKILQGNVSEILDSWDLPPRGSNGSGYMGIRIFEENIILKGDSTDNDDLKGDVIIGDIWFSVTGEENNFE
jgi:hypothetical protein